MAGELRIVSYEKRFEADVVEICWRTGLMGESLEGRGLFEDKRLFGLLFCLQLLEFEPESCFVAVASGSGPERAVGYVLGTARAAELARDFDRRMIPRIVARLFLYDWWSHPRILPSDSLFRPGRSPHESPRRPRGYARRPRVPPPSSTSTFYPSGKAKASGVGS